MNPGLSTKGCPKYSPGRRMAKVSAAPLAAFIFMTLAACHGSAQAQTSGWRACQGIKNDDRTQLQCFQRWADAQAVHTPGSPSPSSIAPVPVLPAGFPEPSPPEAPGVSASNEKDQRPAGCKDSNYSVLSKFWELQRGTDCDTFSLRGYRPISLAVVTSNNVNTQPSSTAAGRTATAAQPYQLTENKIQLSVRTKIAKGLLKAGATDDEDLDSVWFGYTQQSYWQLFNGALSRPFRTTDHEPEVVYVYPHKIALPGGWTYRLTGAGLAHQSNGQSLPLSRSWNRIYLMGAAEKKLEADSGITVQGRVWQRLRESSGNDDNPGIANYIGRAEVAANWQVNKSNTLGVTVRHSLRDDAHGSARFDWMLAPASSPRYTGLRYHLQLFSGYGDSLVDYNRRRTVLSLGLSLIDW